ncbi:MAG: TIGR01459 family HAD-type hydrolase [Alphaproteobacteria bacterium]|nr:TIGR01459 family HAD-type hydrolase [Alphaproteobacteria bacterium]MCD8526364.1 TIGR01459 family HAD-type hydrolase [Alphaproteobacteria bacterium]MCD8570217.1 TIGR01459 family HAD-type hydrolase [Alphaproteobacteria bacterium]
MIKRLSEIAPAYDHFIIDIFGVIHDGIRPFPETIETLNALRKAGKQICLLSNSPRLAVRAVEHMKYMGISRRLYDHIVTSGEATYEHLNTPEFRSKACWFIGKNFQEDLENLNLQFTDGPEGAEFILNSIPGTGPSAVDLLKRQLEFAASRAIPMICANPDLVVNIGEEQFECAGTFALLYEQMGGRVVYHGKPHEPVYERCHELLGHPDKSRIAAIGDSLHTDIAGANRFGIAGIWNVVGIHWEELRMDHKPEEADLAKLEALVKSQPHKPDYVMKGFKW